MMEVMLIFLGEKSLVFAIATFVTILGDWMSEGEDADGLNS